VPPHSKFAQVVPPASFVARSGTFPVKSVSRFSEAARRNAERCFGSRLCELAIFQSDVDKTNNGDTVKRMKRKLKRGRPRKPEGTTVAKIKISITRERLAKVDRRGPNRSRTIGEMIDEAK